MGTHPEQVHSGNMTAQRTRRRVLAWAALAACRASLSLTAADKHGLRPLRLGLSATLVEDVNLHDARAAMMVWVRSIAEALNLHYELHPEVFQSSAEILHGLETGKLDAVTISILEYRRAAAYLDGSQIAVAAEPHRYLVLTRRAGGASSWHELQGSGLVQYRSFLMCIARPWLEVTLAEAGLPPVEKMFGRIREEAKAARVILPVFFGQEAAALTTERAFRSMAQLNPQVGKELAPLASSGPLFTHFFLFRKGYQSPYRQRLLDAAARLRETPGGRQLITLFQFDASRIRDVSALAEGLSILEKFDRLQVAPRRGT